MMNKKEKYFYRRTMEHIHRVQKNALYLVTECWEALGLREDVKRVFIENVMDHDSTKFSVSQFGPYVEFTWCKKEGIEMSEDLRLAFGCAWSDHKFFEDHHPKIGKFFVQTNIVEMACDLQAMAQERGDPSAREYFENVWQRKQKDNFGSEEAFGDAVELMSKCFDCFERMVK